MDTSYVMGLDLGPPNEHTALAVAEQFCPGRDAHYHVAICGAGRPVSVQLLVAGE